MIQLLKAATESQTGEWVNVRGMMGHATRIRAWGSGTDGAWTGGGSVTIEGSMSGDGSDVKTVGTIASGGNDITIIYPYERIRAKTGSGDTDPDTIDVYMECEKELAF